MKYYSFVACNSLNNKEIEKLEILQRKLNRQNLRLMASTPNIYDFSEAGKLPLRFGKEYIITKRILKDETYQNHISHKYTKLLTNLPKEKIMQDRRSIYYLDTITHFK